MPPNDVPPTIQKEYIEAARVEPKSLRAAAALARRCLQSALRAQGFRAKRLVDEIEMAEKDSRSTATLVAKLHMLREIGNYAAHPTEDAAGTIVDVEPGEVDVLFDALDELFDVFWVKPEVHKKQLAALNAKLVAAGKKPIS